MQALLIGYTILNFKSSSGDEINGTQLFYAYTDEKTVGYKTDKVFVRKGIELPEMKPNDTINLFFDRKGKVEAVTVTKK